MSHILHQFRWTLRRRYREIIGLFLLWLGLLLLPNRPDHMEDGVMASLLMVLCVIAGLGVFLDTLIDTPAMGTNQFWRTRPVTWGKMLVVQLLLLLVLLMPALAVWALQCWWLRAGSDFLLGAVAILVLVLAGAASVATAASFANGRTQFVWVIPLAIGLGYIWWNAISNHGLLALPIGFIILCLISAMGMERGKWKRRAGLGLLVLAATYLATYIVRGDGPWKQERAIGSEIETLLAQTLSEQAELPVRDEQQHLRTVLAPSAEYSAPAGVVVPVAERISAVLPLPQDIPTIKTQLNLPATTRWYESSAMKSHGELQFISTPADHVFKVISRERMALVLGESASNTRERTTFSAIQNEEEQLVISGEQLGTLWEKAMDTKYFLYSAARSLVLPTRVVSADLPVWLPIWLKRINSTLSFALPPGELLSGGPWRDEELSALEIISIKSRPCRQPLPLEKSPAARTEQLQDLAKAIELFGHPTGYYRASYDEKVQATYWDVYGKEGMNVLLQAASVQNQYLFDRPSTLFRAYSKEELVAQAGRNVGWFANIARCRDDLPLGETARELLRSGAEPDIGLLAYAMQGAKDSDYPLILKGLENVRGLHSQLFLRVNPWMELVKLPGLEYQPTMRALWKRFHNSNPPSDFTFAAALSGEIEAMDITVLDASSNFARYQEDQNGRKRVSKSLRSKPWTPVYDAQKLVPEAPQDSMEFFKWYAKHRTLLTWDEATMAYRITNK
jgi:hypothetical protein